MRDSRDAVREVLRRRPVDVETALVLLVRSYDRVDAAKHSTPEFYDEHESWLDRTGYGRRPLSEAVHDIVKSQEDCVLPVALLIEDRIFNRKMEAYREALDIRGSDYPFPAHLKEYIPGS